MMISPGKQRLLTAIKAQGLKSFGLISLLFVNLFFTTGCSSSSNALDELLGGFSSAPILSSVSSQLVSQTDTLSVDVNNIKDGSPGNDSGMTYTCMFDQIVDSSVETGLPCPTVTGSTVTFDSTSGTLVWTPTTSLGNYEVKITGSNGDGSSQVVFPVGVRLKFGGITNYTSVNGLGATANWTPNPAAQSYQLYKLNTVSGEYELYQTAAGGMNSSHTITGLAPNLGYTFKAQAVDTLGFVDGNAVTRSFTTTSLVKFALSPASQTVPAGTALPITVTVTNADDSPQTVGGLTLTTQIEAGTGTGTLGPVTDNNNGTYTFTFTPNQVGTLTQIGVHTGMSHILLNTSDITIVPAAPSPITSTLTTTGNAVVSGQSVTLVATLKDAYNNPILGSSTVAFTKVGGTSTGTFSAVTNTGPGVYTATYTGVVAGSAQTIGVTVNGSAVALSETIQVIPGPPISANSTIAVAASPIASGTSTTVTATLRDLNNNPVPSGITVTFNKTGGSSSGTFSAVTNAGAGVYTTQYSALDAGTAQTLSVSVDGVALTPTTTVQVVPGAPNLANSTLTTTSTTLNSGSFVTLTATIKDLNGNAIDSGIAVSFSAAGGTSTGTFGAVTNQGAGVYTVRYTGVVAGTAQTVSLLIGGSPLGLTVSETVSPGAPETTQSTLTVASSSINSGTSTLVTAVIKDANGNRISSGITVAFTKTGGSSTGTFAAVTNAGSGTYTTTYTGVVAGTAQTIGVTIGGIDFGLSQSITVVPAAMDPANSSLAISAGTVLSGSAVTVTATLKDLNNNPISGSSVITFSATGGTSTGTLSSVVAQGAGVYTTTYTGVAAGTAQTVRVFINAVDSGFTQSIAVNPGAPSAAHSSIAIGSTSIISGNSTQVTATVRDANSNLISSGLTVGFYKSGGTSTGTYDSVVNAGSGQYTINYSGVASGTAQTIGFTIAGNPFGPTTTVTVTPGAPNSVLSTFTVSSSSLTAGQTSTLTATIRDANGNPVSAGYVIGFSKTGGTSNGTIGVTTNQGNGVYTASYQGTLRGTAKTFSATVNAGDFGPTQTISVSVGTPNAGMSSLVIAVTPLASGSTSLISALVRDAYSNPILASDGAVTFDASGGTSTGTMSSVTDSGSGNYAINFQGLTAGSATTIRVLVDGTPIAGLSSSLQVVPGPVDATNSVFTIGSSTVQSGSSTALTMNLRDANANAISSGLTLTFSKTAGVSDGTVSAITGGAGGNYSATYTATIQGAAQTITLLSSGASTGLSVSVTVLAGAPTQLGVSQPANPRNSIDCNGPYTITLQDLSGNTTSQGSVTNIALSSAPASSHDGTIFSDGACSVPITSLSIAALTSQTSFYYKSYLPQSITLTLSAGGGISNRNISITNIPVVSWLGTASSFTMTGSGTSTVMDDRGGGLWAPQDSVVVGTTMYVADMLGNRVLKYDLTSGTFTGWIGNVGSLEGLSAGCQTNSSGGATVIGDFPAAWCTGGRASQTATNILYQPRAITADAIYLYVAANHRIVRIRQSDGVYFGWIGRVSTTLPSSCTGGAQGTNTKTNGWCTGGTSTTGTGDGEFNNIMDVHHFGGYLYATDYSNHRIQRWDTNGIFQGWSGHILTSPTAAGGCNLAAGNATPTWCFGGTAQAAIRRNLAGAPGEVAAPAEGYYNPVAVTADANYVYVGDYNNNRVVRIATSSGVFSGWIGRVHRHSAMSPTSPVQTQGTYTTDWTQGGGTTDVSNTTGFGYPTGIKIDGSYLYITDNYQKLIRVDAVDGQKYYWIGRTSISPVGGVSGCSTTPVGGVNPGWCFGGQGNRVGNLNGSFNNPAGNQFGVETDTNYVYVADRDNMRIQRFNKTTGAFVSWFGTSQATASKWTRTAPTSVARTGIDDYSFGDFATGAITTAIAFDPTNNFMYVADANWHRIKKYNKLDGSVVGYIGQIGTFAPTGPASCFGFTSGMTPDWCTGGGRNPAAGTIHGYNSPMGVASDGASVYVANYSNNRIDKITTATTNYEGWIGRVNATPTDGPGTCTTVGNTVNPTWCIGGSAQGGTMPGGFSGPRSVFYDAAIDRLFITDNTGRIAKVKPSDGTFDGITGSIATGTGVGCTAAANTSDGWCTSGTAYAANHTGYGGIWQNGSYITTNSTFIFVADAGNNRITRYIKSTGRVDGILGRLTAITNLTTTASITLNGSAVANPCNGFTAPTMPRVTGGWCVANGIGANISTGSGVEDGAFNTPRGIWADETHLYVADTGNHRVVKILISTGAVVGWRGYIATAGLTNNATCASATAGTVTDDWCRGGASGPGTILGGFDYPAGLSGDANYIYVHDGRNNRIVTLPK